MAIMKNIVDLDSNIWLRGIEQTHITTAKGLTTSGNLTGRIEQLAKYSEMEHQQIILSIDPGDFINIGSKEQYGISTNLPIAYDLWYLWPFESIIPSNLFTYDEQLQWIERILNKLLTDLYPLKPLFGLLNIDDLPRSDYRNYFETNGMYRIKQARFESILINSNFKYGSDPPSFNYYPMYISFPVGPLGVMLVQGILCESELEDGTYEMPIEATPIEGGNEFPPQQDIGNTTIGKPIIEDAYLKLNDVEFPSKHFNGHNNYMHHYIRRWIRTDEEWPIPGELVSLIVRPINVPHVWWFQKSSPFLYAGNWVETEYYTSGIILAILEPSTNGFIVNNVSNDYVQDPNGYIISTGEEITTDTDVGKVYKIRIKDEDLFISSTDFYEYEINERVAVIKKWQAPTENINFDWTMLDRSYDQGFKISTNWMIIPISFYGR